MRRRCAPQIAGSGRAAAGETQPVPGVTGTAYILAVIWIVFKVTLAITLWGAAFIGYLASDLRAYERVGAFVAVALLVAAVPVTDKLGLGLAVLVIGSHFWRLRSSRSGIAH